MKRKGLSVKSFFSDEKYRKPFITGVAVFIIVFIGLGIYQEKQNSNQGDLIIIKDETVMENEAEMNFDNSEANADIETGNKEYDEANNYIENEPGVIFVDIGGSVNISGLFALPKGSRVDDAIEAAGGLRDEAETKYLNRAVVLADGDRLYVPSVSEVRDGTAPPTVGQVTASGGFAGPPADDGGAGGSDGQNTPGSGLINLNKAGSEELQKLNGVGPVTAQKIIDYREKNGGFKRIEELMSVSGIGAKTYEKLRDYITV